MTLGGSTESPLEEGDECGIDAGEGQVVACGSSECLISESEAVSS